MANFKIRTQKTNYLRKTRKLGKCSFKKQNLKKVILRKNKQFK